MVLNGQRHPASSVSRATANPLSADGQETLKALSNCPNSEGKATGGSYPVAGEQFEGGRQGAHSPGHRVRPLSPVLGLISPLRHRCFEDSGAGGGGVQRVHSESVALSLSRDWRHAPFSPGRCAKANARDWRKFSSMGSYELG